MRDEATAAVPTGASAAGDALIERFTFEDPHVSPALGAITEQVHELSAMGFYGDATVDLGRKRTSRIDYQNPATRWLLEAVPGVAEWIRLVPTAAALDPIYRPEAADLPGGHPIVPELREWLRNIGDARGIRSRAAVLERWATEVAAAQDRPTRWLSLACGAAQPILAAAHRARSHGWPQPELTLADIDVSALALAVSYAADHGLTEQVATRKVNVLARRGIKVPAPGYDLVEAVGLLEYLLPEDWSYRYGRVVHTRRRLAGARTFLRNAFDLVRPGGVLVVGNMLDTHPQLGFTLNVVQWPHIRPRSVAAMLTLIREAGLDGDVRVTLPDDGVYAMYRITKRRS